MLQLRGSMRDRRRPISRDQLVAGKDLRLEKAVLGLQIFEVEPAVVAHPGGIDGVILTWSLAIDHVFARPDHRVATSRAARAKAFRFLQEPDAHLETKIRRSQRPDR